MFEALVKQGEALEAKTRQAAGDAAAAARGAASARVSEVKKNVGGTWDKLEEVFAVCDTVTVLRAASRKGPPAHSAR